MKRKKVSKSSTSKDVDVSWIADIPECPVYKPTVQEFEDPLEFVKKISPVASKYGLCKVISPLSASVSAGTVLMKEKKGFKFTSIIQPLRLANCGETILFYKSSKKYTFKDFERMANKVFSRKYSTAATLPPKFIEQEFWREMAACRKKKYVNYGADIDGSGFSSSPTDQLGQSKWNFKNLATLPNSTLRLLETRITGITEPMLYIGMLFSTFAWHVEDHYLYSVNYNHCGASKTWYGVPSHAAQDFEKVVAEHFINAKCKPDSEKEGIFDSLLGKTTMFAPDILLKNDVPVYKTEQRPGEFVFTFPRAYHSGFSNGFNCAEAVNFAFGDWFPMAEIASHRYSLCKRSPHLPFEELLCKEAMLLALTEDRPVHNSSLDSPSEIGIKSTFVKLIRLHNFNRWRLLHHKLVDEVSRNSEETVFCSICNRDCYVSHIKCNGCMNHVCVREHETLHEVERGCSCDQGQVLSMRKDIKEMESICEKFEIEKDNNFKEIFERISIDEDDYVPFRYIEEEMLEISRVLTNKVHPENVLA